MQVNSVQIQHYDSAIRLPKRFMPLAVLGTDNEVKLHFIAEFSEEWANHPCKILATGSYTADLTGWNFIGSFKQWNTVYFLFLQAELEPHG